MAVAGIVARTQLAPLFDENPAVAEEEVLVITHKVPVQLGGFHVAVHEGSAVVAAHFNPSKLYAACPEFAVVVVSIHPLVALDTTKLAADKAVPPVFVTAIGPVVAPAGTVVVIDVLEATVYVG